MQRKPPFFEGIKRVAVITSASIAVLIIIISGFMLVQNAKLHQGDKNTAVEVSPKQSLSVVAANSDALAPSDSNASSSALQGSSAGNINTVRAPDGKVQVSPLASVVPVARVCDEARKLQLTEEYTKKVNEENSYHNSLLGFLGGEVSSLLGGENERHNSVLASLEKTLADGLANAFCS